MAVLVLLGLDFLLRELSRRSRRVRQAVEGEPRLLIRDGRLLQRALREEGLEAEDVRSAVRAHGLARIEDVRLGVLETDGSISIVGAEGTDRPPGAASDEYRRQAGRAP